jgi:glycine cleavage system H protein
MVIFMDNPTDRFYSREHEWIKIEGNTGVLGITFHAQSQLHDVVFIELPKVGQKIEAMKPYCVIESVKSVSDVYTPVDGEVVEINKELENHPELVNESPYDKGWIAKIKITAKGDKNLMSAKDYETFLGK